MFGGTIYLLGQLADIVIVRRWADIDVRATPAYAQALARTLLPA
jgi:hypothetical protein